MSNDILAYASVLRLSRSDTKILNIKDAYSLHKVVYGLFEDIRTDAQKQASVPSGISYVDKGGDFNSRQILMVSNRKPHQSPQFGLVETKSISAAFLAHGHYGFEITINPSKRDKDTKKITAIRGNENVASWFKAHAESSWGFGVNPNTLQVLQVGVQTFEKEGKTVTHGSASIKGELTVIDQDRFKQSFIQGIGRGRAFGFGLLQIIPLNAS